MLIFPWKLASQNYYRFVDDQFGSGMIAMAVCKIIDAVLTLVLEKLKIYLKQF